MTAFGRYVQVMATERCNLRCVHCAVPEEDSPAMAELSTDTWISFIERLADRGVVALTLSGGEVTLRRDASVLLRCAIESGIGRVTLLTNGLLSERTIKELVVLQSQYPSLGIHVSLDGASPATHDQVRGRGAFKATMGRIARLRDLGGRTTGMHTVLHQGNIDEFDSMVGLVRELGVDVWTVFPVAALGRAVRGDLRSLTAQQWVTVTSRLAELRRSGLDVGQMGPVVEDEWPSSLGALPNGRSAISPNIVVGPDGAMFTCPPLRDRPIGWASTMTDPEAWAAAITSGREMTAESCGNCKFRLLCTGIDLADPFAAGNYEHRDPSGRFALAGKGRGD